MDPSILNDDYDPAKLSPAASEGLTARPYQIQTKASNFHCQVMDASILNDKDLGTPKLGPAEVFWREHYNYLKAHGYTLRKRYHPEWVPSWTGTRPSYPNQPEDSQRIIHPQILDAIREDGTFVILKRVEKDSLEIQMAKLLSSEKFASDTRNHCVPILQIIPRSEEVDTDFMVMPVLYKLDHPKFETIGEAIDLCRQLFEGLHFLHENNIIHGDIKHTNVLADTVCLFDSPPHAMSSVMKRDFSGFVSNSTSRTMRPIKYYFIDLELAEVYQPEDAPFLRQPPWGGDRSVPEHQDPNGMMCDPFAVDVYCLGNLLRRLLLDGEEITHTAPPLGFDFMREFINDMVNVNPSQRPSMSEVVSRFDAIVHKLGNWKLRSPYVLKDKKWGIHKSVVHWKRQLARMFRGIPAIPKA